MKLTLPWQSQKPATEHEDLSVEQERYVAREIEIERRDIDKITRARGSILRKKWVIFTAIGAGIVGFGLGMSNSSQINQIKNEIADGVTGSSAASGATSPGRFAATQSVQQWLASSPAPLPGGSIQSWNGATQLTSQTTTNSSTNEKVMRETDAFTLVDGYGQGYTATVEVAYTAEGETSVVAGPSLTPLATSANSDFAGTATWPGLSMSSPSSAVNTAIQQWAQAFTSGNASTLEQAVGDPASTHKYLPLNGITSVSVSSGSAAMLKNGQEIVQVSVTPQWAGRSYSSGQNPTPMQFDVLVTSPNTSAPRVVAWGSPGSGPTLKAYQNAVIMTSQAAAQSNGDDNSNAAPSPTSSATSTVGGGTAPKPAVTQDSSAPSASDSAPSASHAASASASSTTPASPKKK